MGRGRASKGLVGRGWCVLVIPRISQQQQPGPPRPTDPAGPKNGPGAPCLFRPNSYNRLARTAPARPTQIAQAGTSGRGAVPPPASSAAPGEGRAVPPAAAQLIGRKGRSSRPAHGGCHSPWPALPGSPCVGHDRHARTRFLNWFLAVFWAFWPATGVPPAQPPTPTNPNPTNCASNYNRLRHSSMIGPDGVWR